MTVLVLVILILSYPVQMEFQVLRFWCVLRNVPFQGFVCVIEI